MVSVVVNLAAYGIQYSHFSLSFIKPSHLIIRDSIVHNNRKGTVINKSIDLMIDILLIRHYNCLNVNDLSAIDINLFVVM